MLLLLVLLLPYWQSKLAGPVRSRRRNATDRECGSFSPPRPESVGDHDRDRRRHGGVTTRKPHTQEVAVNVWRPSVVSTFEKLRQSKRAGGGGNHISGRAHLQQNLLPKNLGGARASVRDFHQWSYAVGERKYQPHQHQPKSLSEMWGVNLWRRKTTRSERTRRTMMRSRHERKDQPRAHPHFRSATVPDAQPIATMRKVASRAVADVCTPATGDAVT